MTLKLLVDEDSQDKILVRKLKDAGHDVLTAKDTALLGQPDRAVLAYAVANNRIVLTRNCDDFCTEASIFKASGGHHHGIFLRYEKNNSKDMSYDEIVHAIDNIEKMVAEGNLVLKDLELSLSYYRY